MRSIYTHTLTLNQTLWVAMATQGVLSLLRWDYSTMMGRGASLLFMVSMKGYMHLSEPMKR